MTLRRFDLETNLIVMFSAERNVKSFSFFKQGQSLAVKARRHETNTPAGVWDRARRWRGPRSARCRASRSKAHLYHLNTDFHPQQPRKHHPPSLAGRILFILIGFNE